MKGIGRWIEKAEAGFLTLLFAVAFIVIAVQAISRYVFGSPVIWTDEVSTTLQMIIGFLGIGYGIRHKSHIKVDGLFKRLPEPLQHIVSILINVVFIVLSIMLIQYGMRYVMREWNVSFGTFPVGKGKLYLAMPIGFAIAVIYSVFDSIDQFCLLLNKPTVFSIRRKADEITME